MKDILRKSVRKRDPCRKTWGWEKRWEEARVLEAFWRSVREVAGMDLASSILSRPCVERSSCPDTVTLGWREFSPIFGNGLCADGLINPNRFRNSSWATTGEKKKNNKPNQRLSVLDCWRVLGCDEAERFSAMPCGTFLRNRSHGKTSCVTGRKRKILLDS